MVSPSRTPPPKTSQAAAQQKKLGLIAVLATAFLAVLYVQFFSGDGEPHAVTPTEAAAAVPTPATVAPAPKPDWMPALEREYAIATLKSRTVEQIIGRHPFAIELPEETVVLSEVKVESVPEPQPLPLPEPEAEPEPLMVSAIYATPNRSAALVGEAIVRSGEDLPDGRKLIAASPLGLKTEATSSPSSAPQAAPELE